VDKLSSLSGANSHVAPVDYSLVARDGMQVFPGGSHAVARSFTDSHVAPVD